VANPQVAIIVVRTDNFRVGTSEDRVTVVVGASVQIVTKEDLWVDASSFLTASIVGTDGRIVTDQVFGPIAVVSVVGVGCCWRDKDNAFVDGTCESIVTVCEGDTSWAQIRTIGGVLDFAGLVEDSRGGVLTRWATVLRGRVNNVFLPLGLVVAITFRPVGESVSARFRAQRDISVWARDNDDVTIRLSTGVTSTNLRDRNNKSLGSFTIGSIVGTVTCGGFVSTNAVDWRNQDARERCVGQVLRSTDCSVARALCKDGSSSDLVGGVTSVASWSVPWGPIGKDAVNNAANIITSSGLGGVSDTLGSSVLGSLVDDTSTSLGSSFAGLGTWGPVRPLIVSTINFRTSGAVWNITSSSGPVTVVLLTTNSLERTVDRLVSASAINLITDWNFTKISWWTSVLWEDWGLDTSISRITSGIKADVSGGTVQGSVPVAMQRWAVDEWDTSILGTSVFVGTFECIDTFWSNVGARNLRNAGSCGVERSRVVTWRSENRRSGWLRIDNVVLDFNVIKAVTSRPVGEGLITSSWTSGDIGCRAISCPGCTGKVRTLSTSTYRWAGDFVGNNLGSTKAVRCTVTSTSSVYTCAINR
jgi:hypothetical protein